MAVDKGTPDKIGLIELRADKCNSGKGDGTVLGVRPRSRAHSDPLRFMDAAVLEVGLLRKNL